MAQQVDERPGVLMKKAWVVYTKSYLTQADTVVKYLAQYSHDCDQQSPLTTYHR